MAEGTQFSAVYNRFLDKITDDMYMELTPQDTIKDLRNLLINAIPEFEFPRKNLMDYTIEQMIVKLNNDKMLQKKGHFIRTQVFTKGSVPHVGM